jgi:hypothetical protein
MGAEAGARAEREHEDGLVVSEVHPLLWTGGWA